jgi:hypothetical protein
MNTSAGRGLLLILAIVGLCLSCSNHKKSPKPNSACSDTNPCQSPLTCVDNVCRQSCDDQNKCSGGLTCQSGYCVTLCQAKEDCADGEECSVGICYPICIDNDKDGYGENCPLGNDCNDENININPSAIEICSDNEDNDCNGVKDDPDCKCTPGTTKSCYNGAAATVGLDGKPMGTCHAGTQTCGADKIFGKCEGEQLPTGTNCNGLDNDCDGVTDVCATCDPGCQCAQGDPACTCKPPTNQPCYTGPVGTVGVGECKKGVHDCTYNQEQQKYIWTECEGQQPPAVAEVCGDGLDNDCDKVIDNGCNKDKDGDGYETLTDCDDSDPAIHPGAVEACDGIDNNCDGRIDEGCSGCIKNEQKDCYSGPHETAGVGNCKWGKMTCINGEYWSACVGEVLPQQPKCGNGNDYNCNGIPDNNELWAVGANACGTCGDPPTEVCNGVDDNCNGLIDEGVLQACGRCPNEPPPCYEENWDNPGQCKVIPAPVGQSCDDGIASKACGESTSCVTLGTAQSMQIRYLWVSIWNHNEVAKIDTTNGAVQRFNTHGTDPSRTAVAPDDQSVWVANRCRNGTNGLPACSNIVHLDVNGKFMCRGDVTGVARGLAIDDVGRVWAGNSNSPQTIYRFDGTARDASCSETNCDPIYQPNCCCKLIDSLDVHSKITGGEPVYGMAFDGSYDSANKGRYIWVATVPTLRIDVNKVDTDNAFTLNSITQVTASTTYYGIAVDHNRAVWVGDAYHGNSGLRKIVTNANGTFTVTNIANTYPNHICVTGITVDSNGYVWANRNYTCGTADERVVKIDPSNNTQTCTILRSAITNMASTGLWGIAEGANNTIWITPYGGSGGNVYAYVLKSSDCTSYTGIGVNGRVTVDSNHDGLGDPLLYTYSDMTGSLLAYIVKSKGRWTQYFDSGYLSPIWDQAQFCATIPELTSISLSFSSADDKDSFSSFDSSCKITFTNSSTNAGACNIASPTLLKYTVSLPTQCVGLPSKRWLRVFVDLSTTNSANKPILENLDLSWTRILPAP